MMKYILFMLTEYYFEEAFRRRDEILKRAGSEGVRMLFRKLCLEREEEVLGKVVKAEDIDPGEMLILTDDPSCFQKISVKGYFVIAVYHKKNEGKSFPGAKYAVEDIFTLEYRSYKEAYLRLASLPWDILETKHLEVRESTVFDVEDFYRIYKDPSITCYMEDLFPEKESEIAYMKAYIEQIYGFYGFGMWTVLLKSTGQVIGRAGLSVREGYELPELGFVIDVQHQKKGYAYEVCSAILDYAAEELFFEKVQALVQEENAASAGLLNKLGFLYERDVIEGGQKYRLMIKKL